MSRDLSDRDPSSFYRILDSFLGHRKDAVVFRVFPETNRTEPRVWVDTWSVTPFPLPYNNHRSRPSVLTKAPYPCPTPPEGFLL